MGEPAIQTTNTSDGSAFAKAISDKTGLGDLPESLRRIVLTELVKEHWGNLPSFSTLQAPEISMVAKATVGTGVVPIFLHPTKNEWSAVVLRPGTHYRGRAYTAEGDKAFFMIAGGFINLSNTEGVPGLFPAKPDKAESPVEGALRELIEEIVDDRGQPVLKPSPDRLFPMDALTLTFPTGECRLVIGYVVKLVGDEISKIISHVERVGQDEIYRKACRMHTLNPSTGEPEVCQVDVLPVSDLAANNYTLLHPNQRGLFQRISRFLTVPNLEFLEYSS